MSSTTVLSREVGPDGIRRYRTRVKVLIHSHNSDNVIDVTSSISRMSSTKMLKSVGNLNLSLTAERNWLNAIFPNDHINVYVNRSDGQGWVRLFYGFIDDLEETSSVDGDGAPMTAYSLQCSDFQKAFEKTQIYFNPHVASRADFNGGFIGTPNIGGLGLMTRGVRINGSPADLVTNVTLLLMGFGTQFILPTSYNPRLADRIRAQRADFILNRLSEDARRQVVDAGGYADFLERLRTDQNITTDTNTLIDPDSTSASEVQRAERARFREAAIGTLGGPGSGIDTESSRGARERGIEAYNVLNTTLTGYPPSLLDVLDIFTFVERQAIDGYLIGAPMWERQGSVMSFLRFVSNEVVNELFFDLRPVSRDGGLIAGTDFSRDLDEISGNEGTESSPAGTQYVPAIIMREYPFATVQSIDASDISLTVRATAGDEGVNETLGLIYFGAIFSDQPNIPGRHIVKVPNMNADDLSMGRSALAGTKHLDVAVVYNSEIKTTKFRRADDDHYNLFEFYSDAILGNDARFFMQDLLPIITPVHIVRHGLRVRSLTTRFGRFSLDTVNRIAAQPVVTDEVEEAPETPPPASNETISPVDLVEEDGRYVQGHVSLGNTWKYRNRRSSGTRSTAFNGTDNIAPEGQRIWRFHNGVDIVAREGVPVRAIRDGWVVAAAPANADGTGKGGFGGYGGTVIIYHDNDSPAAEDGTTADGAVFSLYAHLSSIDSAFAPTTAGRDRRFFVSPELQENGRYTKQRVRAGQVIGAVGRTGFRDSDMGAHLHFEIIKKVNGRVYPSMNRDLTPDILTSASQLITNGGWAPAGSRVSEGGDPPPNPSEASSRSQDPVRFVHDTWGFELPVGPRLLDETTPADPADEDAAPGGEPPQVYTGDANEFDSDPETAPSPVPMSPETPTPTTTTTLVGHVDTPSTRRQIARWALLNDHWYQHNLEYLAGTIEMRGAPEIRVGYRLDLPDRNLSFYVEGVSHDWSYPQRMSTTLHVTRGQPTNPYVSYVLPYINGFDPTSTQRQTGSRLASYFIVPDPLSVRRATKIDSRGAAGLTVSPIAQRASSLVNEVDMPNENGTLKDKYDEQILPAESVSVSLDLEEALQREQESLGLRAAGTTTSTTTTNPMGGIENAAVEELFPTIA